MKLRRFEWDDAAETAAAIRAWGATALPTADVAEIERKCARAAIRPCSS